MGRATAGVCGGETTRRLEIHHGGEVQVVVTADRKETYPQIARLSIANRKNRGVARRMAKLQTPPNLITADRKETYPQIARKRVRRSKTGRGDGTVGSGKVCVVAPIVRGQNSTPIRATLGQFQHRASRGQRCVAGRTRT